MNETLDGLKERGLEPLGQASVGSDGNTQAWLADPDGNLIEPMQIAPDSLQGTVRGGAARRSVTYRAHEYHDGMEYASRYNEGACGFLLLRSRRGIVDGMAT